MSTRHTSFFRRYRFERVDFYRKGKCWPLFELPWVQTFFSGDMYTINWWRFSVVFYARRNTEPY